MPGLESFCVCTAIGLGSIYLLQVSWFVAWMTLDEQRVENARNALLPCISHSRSASTSSSSELQPGDLVYAGGASFSQYYIMSYDIKISWYNFYCQGFNISYLRRVASKVSETYIRDVSSMLWNYAFLFAFPTCVLWCCSRLERMRTKESANYYKFYDTFHCIAYPDNIFCNVGRISLLM